MACNPPAPAGPCCCSCLCPGELVRWHAHKGVAAQANLDKTKVNLGELDRKLQHEQAKLGTYNEDLKAYKDKCAADPTFVLWGS